MPVPRKLPLKGGSDSNMNEIFLKYEGEPSFRGDGGQKLRTSGKNPL